MTERRLGDYLTLGHTLEEAVLLIQHDALEELHSYIPNKPSREDLYGIFCRECGDTEEGLMHSNTWRNVEPLIQD